MADGVVATITISAVNYSVYAFTSNAVQDADQYFAADIAGLGWTSATTLQKQQALVTAQRMLDSAVRWAGTKTVSSQALEFPRDGLTYYGVELADNLIPDKIVLGEFQLALALLNDPSILTSGGTGSNLKRAKAGSAEVEYFRPTLGTAFAYPFPVIVNAFVHAFYASALVVVGPTANGTDSESAFSETGDFELNLP